MTRLVGRDAEQARIGELLSVVHNGGSGVLVIHGEPGIGKTALLDAVIRQVSGVALLRTRCVESEAHLAFSALGDLLRPTVDLVGRLPGPQRRALLVSLELADPATAAAPNSVAVGLGALGLLAEYAPALVVVDDMHWMDRASRGALLFAARRVEAEGVALLFAVRSGMADTGDLDDLPTLRLTGLSPAEAGRLLAEVHGTPVDRAQVEWLMRHSGGNPLALIELARQGGRLPAGGPERPPAPPETIAAAYRRRLALLAPDVVDALLFCAASFTGDTAEIAAALGHDGWDALHSAEAAGLVTIAERVEFTHPMVRSTVYHDAGPGRRRAVHRALAAVPADSGPLAADRRVWHLAAATIGQDEEVAAALDDLGGRIRQRGALHEAYSTYLRAVELSAPGERRTRRALNAAAAARLAGDAAAAEAVLDRAHGWTSDTRLLAEIEHARGQIRFTRSPPHEHFAALAATARAMAHDPHQAAALWTTAAGVGAVAGLVRDALAAAEQAHATLPPASTATPASLDAAVLHAHTLLLAGEHKQARRILAEHLDQLVLTDPLQHGIEVFGFATMDLMWLDDHTAARRLLDAAISRIRRAQALERLPSLLAVLADLQTRRGRWREAYTAAAECIAHAEAVGQPMLAGYAASTLARVEAALGSEQRCDEYARQALTLLEPISAELVTPYVHLALGQLQLSLDCPDKAANQLTALDKRLENLGVRNPAVFPYHADLVEALFRRGDPQTAAQVTARLAERAGPDAAPATRAALARCRGLLAPTETDAEEHFEQALQADLALGSEYAAARTRLLYGERLRRDRRRALAQQQLNAARLTFERLGARPWAHRAAREHRVSTGRRTQTGQTQTSLTGQELQVAQLVADGRSNREAATALLLSAKTIEYHLRNVYTKLGIHSRVELVHALSTLPGPPT